MKIARINGMQLTSPTFRSSNLLNSAAARMTMRRSSVAQGSGEASTEIRAYITVRDMAVADAERSPSEMTLNRAFLANETVESCLQPVRSPYQAQCLVDSEAVEARQRCASVRGRLHELRACQLVAA